MPPAFCRYATRFAAARSMRSAAKEDYPFQPRGGAPSTMPRAPRRGRGARRPAPPTRVARPRVASVMRHRRLFDADATADDFSPPLFSVFTLSFTSSTPTCPDGIVTAIRHAIFFAAIESTWRALMRAAVRGAQRCAAPQHAPARVMRHAREVDIV